MGILGTSRTEEDELRAAASHHQLSGNSRASVDASASSAYETASEFASEDEDQYSAYRTEPNVDHTDAESNTTIQNLPPVAADLAKENLSTDNDDEFIRPVNPDLVPTGDMTENELNRIATMQSQQGVTERHSLSRTQSRSHHEIDPRDLEWDGPDDKENPFNWPNWKKWFITFTTAITCLCISLGSSLFVEGVPEIVQLMGVSETLAISGLTFYLLGLALGPVVAAPLSEMIGRRWIYITTFPISMLFTMGVGLATNIRTILVLRFFSGLVASPPMSIAGGTIGDLWGNAPHEQATAMALFCVAPFLGPVIGPVVGGFAAEHKGWKWTMWVSLMFSGAILPFLLVCPETFKLAILKKRAQKRGYNLKKEKFNLINAVKAYLFRPLEMLVVEPIVCLSSIYVAFVFAVLFGFFEAFPIIFRGVYLMDTGVSGLPFIGVGIGLILGVIAFIILNNYRDYPKNPDGTRGRRDENGNYIWDAPETKLLVAQIGAFFLPIALFWLAWTSRKSIHWIAPTLSGVPFGFGLIWVFFGIVLYYSMSFPPAYVASALAANNLLRYVMAAVFPLFIIQMYDKLHIDWATSLLAFIALAMVPIPFVFRKFGERLRKNSKYGYAAYFKALAARKAAVAEAAKHASPAPAEEKLATSSPSEAQEGSAFSSEQTGQDVAEKV